MAMRHPGFSFPGLKPPLSSPARRDLATMAMRTQRIWGKNPTRYHAMPDVTASSVSDIVGIAVQRLAQDTQKGQVEQLLPTPPPAPRADTAAFSPEALAMLASRRAETDPLSPPELNLKR